MTPSNPYTVAVIFLHPGCNMRCTFCITEENFDAMSQAQELLMNLRAEDFRSVVFGGGEPFEWPGDLTALTQEAKRLGFLVQIGTNAIALPKEFESIPTIDRYVLPLESVDSRVHNTMRLYKNRHHEFVVDALKKLRSAGKSATISTIVTKVNKDGLKSLALFLKNLNEPYPFIHAWHLYKFIPMGRGGRVNADVLTITDDEYQLACEEAKSVALPFNVYRRRNMYSATSVDFFWYNRGKLERASEVMQADKDWDPFPKMTVPYADPD